jgi:hypothetical protein
MPAYGKDLLTDSQLNDLQAYMATFQNNRRGGEGESERG